jgi:hypothetical protein
MRTTARFILDSRFRGNDGSGAVPGRQRFSPPPTHRAGSGGAWARLAGRAGAKVYLSYIETRLLPRVTQLSFSWGCPFTSAKGGSRERIARRTSRAGTRCAVSIRPTPTPPTPPLPLPLPLHTTPYPSFRPYAAIEAHAAVLPESMPGVPRRTAAALHFSGQGGSRGFIFPSTSAKGGSRERIARRTSRAGTRCTISTSSSLHGEVQHSYRFPGTAPPPTQKTWACETKPRFVFQNSKFASTAS